MRLQREEKVVIVLLLMALGSLTVAFWAFGPEDGSGVSYASAKDSGLSSVQGEVLEMKPTKSGGNLILRLDSTSMQIFIPASAGAAEIRGKVRVGDRISVRGKVSVYNGAEELAVSRAADVQVISA
ncbi:MAG: hypothetical protein A4E44_01633 [Methanosaeta sp. PtaB.Bin018]|jgi:hypothetical protein|nr:hypothetical protein [Methanothrix sp.]OPX75053.1 MAG: hypothetical protein A4E44_01633 [Methanosaeta sp. PtaB.Bin018]OPY43743.1 MAG: hypothetical protein A4E46_01673 [Methanosaeta sp. PtaU1.Bin016]HOV51465.1 hypothetical protein [Methanothrix sp.]